MTTRSHSLNVLVSPVLYDLLKELAQTDGVSMGQIVRKLIQHKYNHDILHVPTCASGQPCYVPQMHPVKLPTANRVDCMPTQQSPEPAPPPSSVNVNPDE